MRIMAREVRDPESNYATPAGAAGAVPEVSVRSPDSSASLERAIAALVATVGLSPSEAEADGAALSGVLRAGGRGGGDTVLGGVLAARLAAAAVETTIFGSASGRRAAQPDALLSRAEPAPLVPPDQWAYISARGIQELSLVLDQDASHAGAGQGSGPSPASINRALRWLSIRPESKRCAQVLGQPGTQTPRGDPVPEHLLAPGAAHLSRSVDATGLAEYLSCMSSVRRSVEARASARALGVSQPPLVPVSGPWPAKNGRFYVPGDPVPVSMASQVARVRQAAALASQH